MKQGLFGLALLLTGIFSYSVFAAEPLEPRLFAVPAENLSLLPENLRPASLQSVNGLHLVKMTPLQVQKLAESLHTKRSVCGGFTDVQVQSEVRGVRPIDFMTWEVMGRKRILPFDKQTPTYPKEVRLVMEKVQLPRFKDFLTQMSSFEDRDSGGGNGVKASLWLEAYALKLAMAAGRPEIFTKKIVTGGWHKQDSVLVVIPGSEPTLPGVLVGGHMDTFSGGKPGADDDASGSTTAMEIYTALLESGLKFRRTIYVAFYAAEEKGLVGSQRMVQEFERSKVALRGVIQFDMVGYRSPKDTQEMYLTMDYTDPQATSFLKTLAITYLGLLENQIAPIECGYACSDHASWNRAGYSAVFPFEASFKNYNKKIHTSADDLTLIDFNHAMKFVRLGAAYMVEMADPVGTIRRGI